MRLIPVLFVVTCLALLSACSSVETLQPWSPPEKYSDAIAETQARAQTLDRRIITQSWKSADQEAFILNNLTRYLTQYIPERGVNDPRDMQDFESMVQGLHAAADHVHFSVRLHRHAEAIEWMDVFNQRFNALTARFANGEKLDPDFRPSGVEHGNVAVR
ncbi:MAG: hypothetical protein KDB07_04710 [Planctomycetes bacterium]|nr:hypothetical protein [Planctomycetota bacterium]